MNKLVQESPENYKQTELGSIPQDWQCSYIRDIANIKVGSDVKLEHFSQEAESNYKYPVFSNTVDYPGIYGFYNFAEYTQQAVTVVGRGVGLGTAFVREKGFGAIGRLIVATPYVANAKYLAAYINEYVEVHNESSGVPQLTGIALGDKLVPLPSSEEQTAIANALSDVDELLTELEKLIAKKQAIKTATMQQLLTGKTRLPQFVTYNLGEKQGQPKGTKPSELGEIPEDWDVITIDEALSKKMIIDQMDGNHGELYPKSHEFSLDGVPYVGATDFYNGIIDYKNCKKLPLGRAKKFKKGIALNGDILFAHNATVGPATLVETEEDFIIISTTATYYRCNNEKLKNTYLLSFFKSNLFVKQFSAVMSQSTRNQVPILAQRKFYIVIPSIEEQTAIAIILSDMDNQIQTLGQHLAKTRQIKQGMMQELLTGRTRLPLNVEVSDAN